MVTRSLAVAVVVVVAPVATTRGARADGPPSPSESRPSPSESRLTVLALAALEYVDVEGPGGFSDREPGLIKPRVRAPYVELDKATLTAGFQLEPRLRATMELRADRVAARIDRLYLDATLIDTPCLSR